MKTKLYIVAAAVFAAIGLSLFLSPPAQAAPVCGDIDFTGPCPPIVKVCDDKGYSFVGPCSTTDYRTKDCNTYTTSYEGRHRCSAVKRCIVDRGVDQVTCLAQWNTCRDAVADANGAMRSIDRENCITSVATGVSATPDPSEEEKTSCAIAGVGWIICPVMYFMASIVDQSYGIVSQLLTVPAIDTSTSSDMYKAWAIMRNFANVAFVIAFLIIIYSQMTSIGISNFGIKKMLPRLIIAAILVNVSYWACAIAVDVSNISGASFKGLLEGAANQLYVASGSGVESGPGGNWNTLTVGLLAGGAIAAALYAGLSVLLPMLITALFAIVMVVLVLTMRQALIIILIVISPLAFVAYLLPNTASLFSKWRGLFQTLLIMYPIIAIIFGGCALASTIITNSAGGNFILQVMGAGVTIVPLFIAPFIIKSVNSLLNRFGVNIDDPAKGPFDRMRKGAENFRQRQEGRRAIRSLNGGRTMAMGKYRRAAKRAAVASGIEAETKRAQGAYVANQALEDEAFRNRLGGGRTLGANATPEALNRALAGAVSVQAKIEADEVSAASAVIKHLNLDRDQMRELSQGKAAGGLEGSSRAVRAAAMQHVVNTHDIKGVNDLLDSVDSMDEKTRASFADSLQNSSERPAYVGQAAIADIRQGNEIVNSATKTRDSDTFGNTLTASQQLAVNAVNNNTYSVNAIANGDREELDFIVEDIAANAAIATNNANIKANAETARTDPRYSGQISKNKNEVDKLANL